MRGHRRAGDPLGQPAGEAAAGDTAGETDLDPGAATGCRTQPPAPALVHAGDRCPGEVARGVPLDDLDRPPISAEPTRMSIR